MVSSVEMLTALNLILSAWVIGTCACILRKLPRASMEARALFSRSVFVIVIVSAFCNGFRGPLFGTLVGNWWTIVGGVTIILLLLERVYGWRRRE